MNINCPFCGMPPLDGEPCCKREFQRETMRKADQTIRELRAALARPPAPAAAPQAPAKLSMACDWHEEDGDVLWFREPICEPPYLGSPMDDDFPYADLRDPMLRWVPLPWPFRKGDRDRPSAAAPQAAGEGVSEADEDAIESALVDYGRAVSDRVQWANANGDHAEYERRGLAAAHARDKVMEMVNALRRATPARETPAPSALVAGEKCEGCGAPATTFDNLDDITPLCARCRKECAESETPAARREAVEAAVREILAGIDSRAAEAVTEAQLSEEQEDIVYGAVSDEVEKARAALLALLRPAAGDGGAAVWEKALAIASKCCDEACYEGDETAWLHEVVARLQAASRGEPAGGEAQKP
jgi:hypothetical protein